MRREVRVKNIKFVLISASCGFLLSFICGLFSHGGFLHMIVMAVIFGIVFGALAALIQFLGNGILNVDNVPSPAAAGDAPVDASPKTGSIVNLTIKDEDLPTEENSPQFFVGSNHQMLSKNDYVPDNGHGRESAAQAQQVQTDTTGNTDFSRQTSGVDGIDTLKDKDLPSEPVAETENDAAKKPAGSGNGFIPMPLQETARNMSGTEAGSAGAQKPVEEDVPSADASSADDSSEEDTLEDESLDELPDLEDMKTAGSDEDIVEDSDFSKAGSKEKKTDAPEVKDAALMAKAISTILTKDKENK